MKLLKITPILLLLSLFSCEKEVSYHSVEYKGYSSLPNFTFIYKGIEGVNSHSVADTAITVYPIRMASGDALSVSVDHESDSVSVDAYILIDGVVFTPSPDGIVKTYNIIYHDSAKTDSTILTTSIVLTGVVP